MKQIPEELANTFLSRYWN